MTNHIRQLKLAELNRYVDIMAGAYPGLSIISDEDRRQLTERLATSFEDPSSTIFGLFQDDQLRASMILYDFMMNFRGSFVPAGGLGSLAVDLLYRKQKLAKEMVSFYLRRMRDRGSFVALLYPFRSDFYRRMGFGYGAKMNQYAFRPAGLRPWKASGQIRYLTVDDSEAVLACHNRYAGATHGMIRESLRRIERMLASPPRISVGFFAESHLRGYLTFDFRKGANFLKSDLQVRTMVYEDARALNHLLAFLRTLADQCERIVINTQDESFHYLLDDPRNDSGNLIPSVYHESNTQGIGLMYRIIDPRGFFAGLNAPYFGELTGSLKFTLTDSFLPENNGALVVSFEEGRPGVGDAKGHEVEITMDISDFSSMFMGAITLEQLVAYGLAHISNGQHLERISHSFKTRNKPICTTAF